MTIVTGHHVFNAGRNMLCCAQWYSCALEDLIGLFSGSVRSVVNACVHRCVNDNVTNSWTIARMRNDQGGLGSSA